MIEKGRLIMFEDLFYDRLIKLRTEKKVFDICEYLGVTPSEFFDDGNHHPIEYQELLKDLDALSEENRRNVLAIVKGLKH